MLCYLQVSLLRHFNQNLNNGFFHDDRFYFINDTEILPWFIKIKYSFDKYILISLLPLKNRGGATSTDQPPLVCSHSFVQPVK